MEPSEQDRNTETWGQKVQSSSSLGPPWDLILIQETHMGKTKTSMLTFPNQAGGPDSREKGQKPNLRLQVQAEKLAFSPGSNAGHHLGKQSCEHAKGTVRGERSMTFV